MAVCSRLVVATRGITAGAVHATIELRLLLIQPLDTALHANPHASVSAYVDDVTVEAVGTEQLVHKSVVGATKSFTCELIGMGMEFSRTKNVCSCSSNALGRRAVQALPHLDVKLSRRAKSLGVGLGAGVTRNASVAAKRLQDFRCRLRRFRQQRKRSRRNVQLILKTGGTAGLTFGPEALGVSNTMLLGQRWAVSATLVGSGSGDLDLRLIMAELECKGLFDPAFAAHCGPIVTWATAIWEEWLPLPTIRALYHLGCKLNSSATSPWPRVRGPGTAVTATAARLGWELTGPTIIRTHTGQDLHMLRDSPAFIKSAVEEAVVRWRWAQVEARLPSMTSDLALMVSGVPEEQRQAARHTSERQQGCGAFIQPIVQLLHPQAQRDPSWTGQHAGALLSAITNRQWSQAKHFKVGQGVDGPNCLLCVHSGRCTHETRDPAFTGTLTHRLFLCPSLESVRDKHMPTWLRTVVRTHLRTDQTLPPELLLFLTRALVGHPCTWLPRPAEEGTFNWHVQPADGYITGKLYVDGSERDAEARFHKCCARRGWAFTAVDQGEVVASASGLPPDWVRSIPGTETWALLQAMQVSMPGNLFRTDCQAVMKNSRKSLRELTASSHHLARAWAPIALHLEDADADAVVWMPAHTAQQQVGVARLSDGCRLTQEDRDQNAEADRLAKLAVEADRVPAATRKVLLAHAARVVDVAKWIGTATLAANTFEVWESCDGILVKNRLRDAHAAPSRTRPCTRRRPASQEPTAGRLLEGSRMAALRNRVLARQGGQPGYSPSAQRLVVPSIVATDTTGGPSMARSVKRRKKRTPSLAYRPVALAVDAAVSKPPATGCRSREGLHGLPSCAQPPGPAQASMVSSATQERQDAAEDLLELERSGLRVSLPVQQCSPAAGPQPIGLAAPARIARRGSPSSSLQLGADPEVAAALSELEELCRCGLSVRWP